MSPTSLGRGHSSQDMQRVASFESSGGYFSGAELSVSPNEPVVAPAAVGAENDRTSFESDELEGLAEDRVVAQGYLLCLKNVSGVRQWKRRWVVLRGRSLTLYKNFEVLPIKLVVKFPSICILSTPVPIPTPRPLRSVSMSLIEGI